VTGVSPVSNPQTEVGARIARDLHVALRRAGLAVVSVENVVPFGDGHSGFTYATDVTDARGTHSRVLRLSPPGIRIAGPADVGRQGRIMRALGDHGVAVPRVLACDSAPVVDGRAYALMELVYGTGWARAVEETSDGRVADAAIAALQCLQSVKLSASGISSDEPRTPVAEVARWASLVPRISTELRRPGERLAAKLEASAPPQSSRPVLVHGDFHYGNLLFGDGGVVAILDWEVAHLGERLLDLGSLAVATLRTKYEPEPNSAGSVRIPISDLVSRYGTTVDEARWHVALTCFKYAAILGYNAALHRSGRRPDPIYDQLDGTTHGLILDGEAILATGLDVVSEVARDGR
jgi:aminoglycoside phosphotransferase (APT) family kinase protein